eukprot:TRINITY_DN9309_c0_g3_i2.p1 TRINITY_DN9309_c0_g3~~TRINITY_DN9309_c0_g3_i2.p1  ORF type:complete len:268 (+),score=56.54 TRINITY_DN9309_c0_g3_i2:66-806(+)
MAKPLERPPLDKRQDFNKILSVAFLYTTIAGMLNGVAVYELGTPVGYTSGPCVNAGRFLGTGNADAKKILGICSLFYVGGILAGLGGKSCEGDHIFEGKPSPGMLLSSAMLALGIQVKKNLNMPTLCMQIWALSQGLMNGITSRFSALPMRATHTAGGQTDAALTIAQALIKLSNGEASPPMRKVILNAVCCFGMIFGGYAAGKTHKKFGINTAWIPTAALAFSATVLPALIAPTVEEEDESKKAK